LTATDFEISHNIGATYYHSIPGFDNLFGKGYFRLVRVHEEGNKTTEVPA